jgi:hypothetical protein
VDLSKYRCLCSVCGQPVIPYCAHGVWTAFHNCRKGFDTAILDIVVFFLKSKAIQFVQQSCGVCQTPLKTFKCKQYSVHIGCIPRGFSVFFYTRKCRVDVYGPADHRSWPHTFPVTTPSGWKVISMTTAQVRTVSCHLTDKNGRCKEHCFYPVLPLRVNVVTCPVCDKKGVDNIGALTPKIDTIHGPIYNMNGYNHLIRSTVLPESEMANLQKELNMGELFVWAQDAAGDCKLLFGEIQSQVCAKCNDPIDFSTSSIEYKSTDTENLCGELTGCLDSLRECWLCRMLVDDYHMVVLPRSRHIFLTETGMKVPLCEFCCEQCPKCKLMMTPTIVKTACYYCSITPEIKARREYVTDQMIIPDASTVTK